MESWQSIAVPKLDYALSMPSLTLTDSKTGSKNQLAKKDLYRMYVCGITPYDATHLGHAATYLTFDLLQRYLRASGSEVNYVQNITDIDDPLLERATRDGVDWQVLAHSQIDLFRSDMVALRVIPPAHYIGAVEAIPLVVQAIQGLASKGTTYLIEDDLYFANGACSDFGSLSHLSKKEMETIFSQRGGDPTLIGKKDSLDCLVWMAQRPGEPGWDSELGKGRPGWHIECTAIANQYLSPDSENPELIDIQGGGSDLIFPHHEMCRSQATVLTGKELASTYVHAGMLGLDGEKMSKSKGNLVFVSTLLAEGVDPMVIRYALMMEHYHRDRMWTNEVLLQAQNEINNLRTALSMQHVESAETVMSEVVSALANDLDTPSALHALQSWATRSQKGSGGGDSITLRNFLDALLGLEFQL
jgi:L-cysteine:1D-myo-inositol 2-amino-2-deoxy-alpha-D-glucopyranoside ligase